MIYNPIFSTLTTSQTTPYLQYQIFIFVIFTFAYNKIRFLECVFITHVLVRSNWLFITTFTHLISTIYSEEAAFLVPVVQTQGYRV